LAKNNNKRNYSKMIETKILQGEKLIKYAETRLFGINVYPHAINSIELHNGVLPSQLKEEIINKYGSAIRVIQNNGREPIFFKDNILFIPQYSGHSRSNRYINTITAYINEIKKQGKNIDFKIKYYKNTSRRSNQAFSDYAYDFVAGMFMPNKTYETRRIFLNKNIQDIDTIIFGSTKAVEKQCKIIEKGHSEYLDAQIIEIDNKKILNIGYVFGDQSGRIINHLMREYDSIALTENKKKNIKVFMFGRVGGLDDNLERHNVIFPTLIIDEVDIKTNMFMEYPIKNILSNNENNIINLNVNSVVDETYELLKKAKSYGASCIEMELRESVDAINRSRRWYNNNLNIEFGYAGYVSDNPLRGDTIEIELDSDLGEQAALSEIIKNI